MQGLDSVLIRIEGEVGGDHIVMVYATEEQAKAALELKNKRATPGMFERHGCRIFAALRGCLRIRPSVKFETSTSNETSGFR